MGSSPLPRHRSSVTYSSLYARKMRCFALFALPLLATAQLPAPEFQIDLDQPPHQRHREVAQYFKEDYPNLMMGWETTLQMLMSSEERAEWMLNHNLGQEFMDEIRGFVEEMDHPKVTFERVLLFNLINEVGYKSFCSGVLVTDPTGRVMHGRNLDFKLEYKSGRAHRHIGMMSTNLTYVRNGVPVFNAPSWAGYIGLHTALKLQGRHPWSFQQNTHYRNDGHANLQAQKSGAMPLGLYMRRLIEEDVDFRTAVLKIESTRFSAPAFVMMAGAAPWEGTSMEITRNSSDTMANLAKAQVLSPQIGRWFLVQTNDRPWGEAMDDRRPAAVEMLRLLGSPFVVDEEKMMELMRSEPLFNKQTVLSLVTSPATGYSQALTHGEYGVGLELLSKFRRFKVFLSP
uniref:Acid ceramidase N-terminal domain-containing protein n=1 Tax=Alexandrium catenella TaxID=2925 RepID=A0A7S1W887_ALECA